MRPALLALLLITSASLAFGSDTHEHHEGEEHHEEAGHDHGNGHGDDDHGEDEFADHKAELDGVIVLHAWAQATDGDEARVFMEIENTSESVVMLTGGDAHDVAESVTLIATSTKAGGDPEALSEVDIAPGTEMELVPTGLYFALGGLERPLTKGDSFEMHVELAPLGEIEVIVEVEAADATQHSHAGHAH